MHFRDIRTLTLLQAFDENKHPTQRELAENLDISLGMINASLKELVKNHYLIIQAYPGNRVDYHLTPEGILERTRLSREYIQYSIGLYTQTKAKIKGILHDLENRKARTIAFWGANEIAEIAYVSLKDTSIDLIAVVDDEKHGERFLGHVIISSRLISNICFDYLLDNRLPARPGPTPPDRIAIQEEIIIKVFPGQ